MHQYIHEHCLKSDGLSRESKQNSKTKNEDLSPVAI